MLRLNLAAGRPLPSESAQGAVIGVHALALLLVLLAAAYLVAVGRITFASIVALGVTAGTIAFLYASTWSYVANPRRRRRAGVPTVGRHVDARLYAQTAEAAEIEGRFEDAIRTYEACLQQRGYREEMVRRQAHLYLVLGRTQDAVRKFERLADYYDSKLEPEPRKASAIDRMIVRLDPQNRRAKAWVRIRATESSDRGRRITVRRTVGGSMTYDEGLAERVRDLLADENGLSEKRMFGGLAFLLKGNMCVGVVKDKLMVRVGPDAYANLLKQPHARKMDFTGRPMKGFLYVTPAGYESDEDLGRWVGHGKAYAGGLTDKDTLRRGTSRRTRG